MTTGREGEVVGVEIFEKEVSSVRILKREVIGVVIEVGSPFRLGAKDFGAQKIGGRKRRNKNYSKRTLAKVNHERSISALKNEVRSTMETIT
ncbi:hypothetical protein TNCV_1014601 [Trichonephila clavipes]|uniref:Uncharacterized protein n=1 Tax=Trichonephila clavipes TaxID=2585209 RepID=A0A8X6VXJ2_TRICX|nr:hypothetical protein TNCV_1014601 [Trichonephila clavipes]